MSIFGDIIPVCCLARKLEAWKWYHYWDIKDEESEEERISECMNCGMPAYKRWDNKYNGEMWFCTYCNDSWKAS